MNTQHFQQRRLRAWLDAQKEKFGTLEHDIAVSAVSTTDGVAATGSINLTGLPANLDSFTLDGVVFQLTNSLSGSGATMEILLGADATETAEHIVAAINGGSGQDTDWEGTEWANSGDPLITASNSGGTVTLTAGESTAANSISLAEGATNLTVTAFSGGVDGHTLTATAHGLVDDEGPFLLSTDGSFPGGLDGETFYYVQVVDTNTLQLYAASPTTLGDGNEVEISSAGSGSLSIISGAGGTIAEIDLVDPTDPVQSTATFSFGSVNPDNSDEIVIEGLTYSFFDDLDAAGDPTDRVVILIQSTVQHTARAFERAINNDTDHLGDDWQGNRPAEGESRGYTATRSTLVVTATKDVEGAAGNGVDNSISTDMDVSQLIADTEFASGADGNTMLVSGHTFESGDGPYNMIGDSLPGGLDDETLYWIAVLDSGLLMLYTTQDAALALTNDEVDLTSQGTGSIGITASVTDQSIIEHIRQGELPRVLTDSTDINDFA